MAKVMKDYFEQFLESRDLLDIEKRKKLYMWDPSYPSDCVRVCEYLHDLDRNTPIGLMSDYDCDGIMAGLTNFLGLTLLGFRNVFICNRDASKGYAFSREDVDELGDVQVMITSDVGTGCLAAVEYAKAKGITVIVTDHHTGDLDESTYGVADYFINPMFDKIRGALDCQYDGVPICGAFVSYLVFEQYFKMYPCDYSGVVQGDLTLIRHFAAIATVSDMMPMRGRNRDIVQSMLSFYSYINPCGESDLAAGVANHPVLQNVYTNMHGFIDVLRGEMRCGFNMEFLEFTLIPTINSIKRMGQHTDLFYIMLFSDAEQSMQYAASLKDLNKRRKDLVSELYDELVAEYDMGQSSFDHIFFIPNDVPAGLCGLVAQKLRDRAGHPVCVFQEYDGSYVGSARSFMDFPLLSKVNHTALAVCRGHEPACGIFCESSAFLVLLDQFLSDAFDKYMSGLQLSEEESFDVVMDYDLDFVSGFHRRLRKFVSECEKMGPFGNGFPAPSVLMKVRISNAFCSGMGLDGCAHTKISLGYGLSCMLWNVNLSDIWDQAEDGYLYLTGSMSRTRTAEGSFIQFSCMPVPDGGVMFSRLSKDRMEEALEDDIFLEEEFA